VNHYERLKVSRDAPPEVIRAAYRALANKLHPDRVGGGQGGPDDERHAQMAALNAAYETLINAKSRESYDEALALSDTPSTFGGHSSFGNGHSAFNATGYGATASADGPVSGFAGADSRQGPNTRVDMDWLNPRTSAVEGLWPPTRRTWMLGGGVGGLLAVVLVFWGWHIWGQHQTERALSRQYSQSATGDVAVLSRPDVAVQAPVRAPPAVGAGTHRPTVEELSRMSDEELLQVLPSLDGDPTKVPVSTSASTTAAGLPPSAAPAAAAAPLVVAPAKPHPLDGTPLNLRADRELIDPLAQ
jgi:curved DNA-binding protein CbpA